jgi:replicative DNA helicase
VIVRRQRTVDSTTILAGARETILNLGVDDGKGPQSAARIIEDRGISNLIAPADPGLPTGFHRFDEMTGGLHPSELLLVAARPSVGKTAFALNVAGHVALKLHKKVAIFSLEMSKEQLIIRLMCAQARVDSNRVRLGYITGEEKRRLAMALAAIADAPIYIDDKSAATVTDLHARVRRLCAEGEVHLVIVDYLQLMSAGRKFENRNQEVTWISRGLKLLSHDIHAPLMVLSQLSRAPEARKGSNRPVLSDLRESGSLEQDADVVAFLYREEMYHRDREDLRGIAELILGKQRSGPTGTINLVYLHALTKFENRAEDTYSSSPAPLLNDRYASN